MQNLYIDFDGVILDTIEVTYRLLEEQNISLHNREKIEQFYRTLNWKNLLSITPEIENAFSCIQKLVDSNRFDIAILTHVNSLDEIIEKVKFIRKHTDHLTIIPVPKPLSKTKMVQAKDAVLVDDYSNNLIEWQKAGGISIKFSKKRESKDFLTIHRLDSLLEIESFPQYKVKNK